MTVLSFPERAIVSAACTLPAVALVTQRLNIANRVVASARQRNDMIGCQRFDFAATQTEIVVSGTKVQPFALRKSAAVINLPCSSPMASNFFCRGGRLVLARRSPVLLSPLFQKNGIAFSSLDSPFALYLTIGAGLVGMTIPPFLPVFFCAFRIVALPFYRFIYQILSVLSSPLFFAYLAVSSYTAGPRGVTVKIASGFPCLAFSAVSHVFFLHLSRLSLALNTKLFDTSIIPQEVSI